ncbi:AcsM2 [Desulforapulum autotrophicum HRM2]|uniref:AcsM2 n=2 Tax=Desulforapulum autotrophicum TaxID=2296 RepID=C0QM01_DESAH|nr:AcsM2 [Desulforapulum autotrophicum HRM2]
MCLHNPFTDGVTPFMDKLSPATYDGFLKSYSIDPPENYNFAFDFIDKRAMETPGMKAMIHVDNQENCHKFDLDFFSKQSSRLANGLVSKGITKGDKVMLLLYRRVEFWVAMLALHKIGAIAIPSPFLLTEKDLEYRINFAEIKGIIAEDTLIPNVDRARKKCPDLTVFIGVGEKTPVNGWERYTPLVDQGSDLFPRPTDSAGGNDPLLIFFSSGTTGAPKMVVHTHTYPLGHVPTGLYWHDLEPGDIQLTLADTGWGKAVWGKFYGQWMAGATVFVYDFRGKFEPKNLLKMISRHRVTTFCGPPTVYRFLIQEDLSQYDLSCLKHCTTAGELLNDSVFHTWKKETGLSIFEGYGQTETTLLVATFPFMEPKPGSIGKPVPGYTIHLLDMDGQICPAGVEGEICIKLGDCHPTGLFSGYVKEADKTARACANGYYHTGDKAWADEDGYLWFLGRVDDLIKSSGYRIGPFEVESALVAHAAVLEAAVTGVPDDVRGQAVKATVVLKTGFIPSSTLTRELQDFVKKITAPYKYPRIIDYVDELPKTISGKIKRAEIRAKDNA